MKQPWKYIQILDWKNPPADLRASYMQWEFPEVFDNKPTRYGWVVAGLDLNHPERFALGFRCDIGTFTVIYAHAGVVIEPYVQIGPHCAIISRSTIDNKEGLVHLKRNCRIGAHSTIMPGVTIGEDSLVGAYSFVNKDIPSNVVAMGIPARIVKGMN